MKQLSSWTVPLLALAFLVVLSLGVNLASSYKVYALSSRLDVFSKGNWTDVTQSGVRYGTTNLHQIGPDREKNLYLTASVGCTFSCNPTIATEKRDAYNATLPLIGRSQWFGRFAFDRDNYFYSIDKWSPVPPIRSPIGRRLSSNYTGGDAADQILGWSLNNHDITSFRGGKAIVVVGEFDGIYTTSNDADLTGTPANHVALYDTKKNTWSAMGAGIPQPPARVVSNKDGSILVALTQSPPALWRWNGTAASWRKYDLDLGSGVIYDIAYGTNKLFLLGNFTTLNGVTTDRVGTIQFKAGGVMNVNAVSNGLPAGSFTALWVHSDTQIFVGGSSTGLKAVYEWRSARAVPWRRLGALGLTELPGQPGPPPEPVAALAVF